MLEVKRGPGRPPKVRPEAEVLLEEKPAPAVERLVEIQVLRKYAPLGQTTEVCQTVPAGTVLKVPQHEATRLLKLGGACATDETFN
jgi:hypothetical protein